MSSKSDEIVSMNYSFTSLENGKKGPENQEKRKNKGINNLDKKRNSIKSQSIVYSNNKKYKNRISLPKLDNNNPRIKSKPKLVLNTSSFNKSKSNITINNNINRTFNYSTSLHGEFSIDKKIKSENKNEETPTKTIESLKKEIQNKNKIIESLISHDNNIIYSQDHKNNLVNILSTKEKPQKNGKILNNEEHNRVSNESKELEKNIMK